MIPKEKAKELINKMSFETHKYNAKHCALVAVDEILNEAIWWHETSYYEDSTEFESGQNKIDYWQQVKQEINDLL